MPEGARRRYALVGTGDRGLEMYARPLLTTHAGVGDLVGFYDLNAVRAKAAASLCLDRVPVFSSFEGMIDGSHPDVVIVTSKDSTHAGYICAALRAGCDVITEKPMTIDAERCRQILAAVRETDGDLRVAFNYRYSPVFSEVKRLLSQGEIGEVLSVDFHWYLDTDHGADYFRRWHRRMAESGGLFVHKATHHFDLVNWWLDDHPAQVTADGALRFYGPTRTARGERCTGCAHAASCEFHWDVAADDYFRTLYVEAEAGDGYRRDGCVFDPEIDIYDTMSAIIRYERGAIMTYSLNAYCAEEGMRAAFNGTRGRLEVEVMERRQLNSDEVRLYRFAVEEPEVISVPRTPEGHGGGDERLQDDLFRGVEEDPLGHAAGVMDGAYSILTGVAANTSVAAGGGWVAVADLLGGCAP